jgi:methylmalonyl-CoA epimerase
MEIADIFVVNKADREGADRMAASIEAMLALHTFGAGQWRPPIVRTEATSGKGVDELLAEVARFRAHTEATRAERRRARAEYRLRELLSHRFVRHVESSVLQAGEFEAILDRIAARELDPHSAADGILTRAIGGQASAVALDHVGIAVRDLEQAVRFYRDALGLTVEAPEDVPTQRVRAHFIPAGDVALELLEATSGDSPIAGYLEKRGPGLHHITLRVDDIAAALARLKARGVRLIDEQPRPGAHGSLVAFVHPASAHGVLVELKQKV